MQTIVTTGDGATPTKTTTDGTTEPDYVPLNYNAEGLHGERVTDVLHELVETHSAMVSLTGSACFDDGAFETVEWLKNLIDRAEGEQVVVRREIISDVFTANKQLTSLKIGNTEYEADILGKHPDVVHEAMKQGYTADLAHISDGDWSDAGLAGIAESSSGMLHLVTTDGELACGHGKPDGEPSTVTDLTDAKIECSTCRKRFYAFLRDDIRFDRHVIHEIRRRADVDSDNHVTYGDNHN